MLKNSTTAYGAVTKTFHWVMALTMIGMLGFGVYIADYAPKTPASFSLFSLHKSIGYTVLAFVICRICWHIYSNRPPLVSGLQKFEIFAAHAMHVFLYVGMIGMPLSGWIFSSAAGRPGTFFGLFDMPQIVAENEQLKDLFADVHGYLGYTLMIAIAMHVAAALKHHFLNKDATLRRMLP